MISSRVVQAGLFAAAGVVAGIAPAVADSLVLTPVAVAGQRSPSGGTYFLFGDISLDTRNRTTFTASVLNGRNGIFETSRGEVIPLLLSGAPAPPEAGTRFLALLEAASNSADDFAFIATTLPAGRIGVFRASGGTITTIALAGEEAPTRFGERFDGFDQLYLLDSGDVYFGGALDSGEFGPSRGIFRSSAAGLTAVVAPGDPFDFIRQIVEALQFDVNQSGEVTVLAASTEFETRLELPLTFEMLRLSNGTLKSMAAAGAPVGRFDFLRAFAATFDQVNVDEEGAISFFAKTDALPLGGYFANPLSVPRDNRKLVAQFDPSPISPSDRFLAFGSFALNSAGTMAFAATSREEPDGGFFVQRGGEDFVVARVGRSRPGGGEWHGFLRADLGEEDHFIFTDRQGVALVGIFAGRFLPPPDVLLQQLVDRLLQAELEGEGVAGFLRQTSAIDRALKRGDTAAALRMSLALRSEIDKRAGRSLSVSTADALDSILEDLILSLGGEPVRPPHGGSGPAISRRSIQVR